VAELSGVLLSLSSSTMGRRRERVIGVERWAELRREHFVGGKSIKALARETGMSRNTIRAALRATEPPGYRRAPAGSKLDPFKDEIHRMLKKNADLPGVRVRELLEPLGCTASKTVVDDYLREVRPLCLPRRTFQRTVYEPGEICQFDLWEPSREVPVGHGQTRKGYVVIACLGYSRAGAGALIFSKQIPDLLAGIRRCLWQLGGLAETLVWDRQSGLHAGGGRPTEDYAAFCGALRVGWYFCKPRDPQAKGIVERLQGYAETNFEPGREFANELDFQHQLDGWFMKVNARTHKTLRARPVDRLVDEREVMAPLPAPAPDTDRRWVLRVSPDPYLRFDTCDYSLDPALVGRRVEARITDREVLAVALDTGELACRHQRSFARHRTITALEHARALKTQRVARRERDGRRQAGPDVEVRSLDIYDQLIA
jgi:transposase